MLYTMMQVCRETGMTYEALKFYCNEGLVPNVKRDAGNRRVFDGWDVAWIKSLTYLKQCGMSIQEMKDYVGLCEQGQASIPERKVLLDRKRKQLLEHIRELEGAVRYIDWKQSFYDDVISGRTPYMSNLLPEEE